MTSNPLVRPADPVRPRPELTNPELSGQAGTPSDKDRAAEPPALARRGAKSAEAFRTISEVALELDVPQHVLHFWETKFAQIRPLKRGGGRRYYRPDDMALLRSIHKLLHQDGYTIKGVQRLLKEGARPGSGRGGAAEDGAAPEETPGEESAANDFPTLDLFVEGDEAAEHASDIVPLLPLLSSEKRALLKSVLAELEELRTLLPTRIRSLSSRAAVRSPHPDA